MSVEESETGGPGEHRARPLPRQANVTEDLAESTKRQNEPLSQPIDAVSHGDC